MDIVTHAAMGIVLASPFVESHPAAAACFVFGAVLPDLDALSRVFGKRAFLRWHQTYTHSLPIIALVAFVAWLVLRAAGTSDPWAAPALGIGMTLHALLDVTNTYGITLLAPFSMRRRCLEWVFFIDAFVLAVTAVAVAAVSHVLLAGGSTNKLVVAYAASLVAYWTAKAALRHRAARLAQAGTLSLVPSALVPWRFLGCARVGDQVTTFTLNAINGRKTDPARHAVLDESVATALDALPEFRAMRDLSPAYHVVIVTEANEGASFVCRDLRTRNFGGRFGTLTARLDHDGRVASRHFDV